MDIASVRIHNSAQHPFQVAPFDQVEVFQVGEPFELRNGYVKIAFDADGFMQAYTTLDDNKKNDLKLEFIRYGTR